MPKAPGVFPCELLIVSTAAPDTGAFDGGNCLRPISANGATSSPFNPNSDIVNHDHASIFGYALCLDLMF